MKKLFVFVFVILSVMVLSSCSCESKSGKKANNKVSSTVDTLQFNPDQIGVTEIKKRFIPYPKFDGGTGLEISFSIGIQYQEKIYQVDVKDVWFFPEKITQEKAENEMSDLIQSHYLASNTPKDYLDVIVINGQVVKLVIRPVFILDKFYPGKVIWEK